MTATHYPFTVERLERHDGHWTARLVVYGEPFAVDRRYGSWRFTPEQEGTGHRDLLPNYAAAIQERVRKLERAERREAT